MNKILKTYFTTGEFAKLFDIKKQTLFHYDDIGVFSPEIKGENGYRYYSFGQIEVFNVITILKDLEMPLKDIKDYLDKRSPEELISLLKKEKKVIEDKIKELNKIHSLIQRKIDITDFACNVDKSTLKLEKLRSSLLVKTKAPEVSTHKNIAIALANHIKYCDEHNIYSAYSIGGMLTLDDLKNELYSNYKYFYTQLEDISNSSSNFEKEEGLYLIAYHEDGFYTIDETYKKLLAFIEENNLIVKSYFYEDVLLDDLSVKGYENYTLKISVKVEESN